MINKKLLIGLFTCFVIALATLLVFTQQTNTLSDATANSNLDTGTPERGMTREHPPGRPSFEPPPGQRKKQVDLLEPFHEEGRFWHQETSKQLKSRLDWSALDLSPKQRAQIRQKRREFVISTAELREKLRFARIDLKNAIFKDQAGPEEVKKLASQVAELESELGQLALQNLLEIRKVLTPAQLEKLPTLVSDFTRYQKDLDLTQAQLVQLSIIDQEFAKKRRETNHKIQSLTLELRDLLLQPSMDDGQMKKVAHELIQAKKELIQLKTEFLLRSREILTPSQREKLATLQLHPLHPQHLPSQTSMEPLDPGEE